ncbi:MAG TPA: MarR family transcriptional regulator [Acidimicrobiales bacterium]|nr:MarR family transcriptional regulator [Acidimicrobiales bacterium]
MPTSPSAFVPEELSTPDDAVEVFERALTEVGRAMLRMGVPPEALGEGEHVDRSGYWALVRLDEAPGLLRLSDLASSLELDVSTVSRQVRQLVDTGLVTREPDPADGRACLVGLSDRGRCVLEAVRAARRQVLRQTLARWGPSERAAVASGLTRLAVDLQEAMAR